MFTLLSRLSATTTHLLVHFSLIIPSTKTCLPFSCLFVNKTKPGPSFHPHTTRLPPRCFLHSLHLTSSHYQQSISSTRLQVVHCDSRLSIYTIFTSPNVPKMDPTHNLSDQACAVCTSTDNLFECPNCLVVSYCRSSTPPSQLSFLSPIKDHHFSSSRLCRGYHRSRLTSPTPNDRQPRPSISPWARAQEYLPRSRQNPLCIPARDRLASRRPKHERRPTCRPMGPVL